MSIHHARPAEVVDIHPLAPPPASAGTTTLIKTRDVEVMRMVLPADKLVPEHALPREVIIQVLEGRIEVGTDGHRDMLDAGQLIYLEGDQGHSMHAMVDSSVLVTILLAHKTN